MTGSFDKTVRMWSSDGTLVHHLKGFVSAVTAICYVSRCRVLWTAGGTPDAYLFEPKTGENVNAEFLQCTNTVHICIFIDTSKVTSYTLCTATNEVSSLFIARVTIVTLTSYVLVCCRVIKFVRKCVTHDSTVIRSVASYGIQYGCNMSCLGQNVLFCVRQYNCSLSDIVSSSVSVDNIVHRKYVQSLASVQKSLAECLRECIMISKGCSFCQMISAALSVTLFCFYVRSD